MEVNHGEGSEDEARAEGLCRGGRTDSRSRDPEIPPGLQASELFSELPDQDLAAIADLFVEVEVSAECYVFREGDVADAFFVLQQGRVTVFRDTIGMPMQMLAQLRQGDFFGEMGLLCDVERSASVRATEPCQLLRIERDAFLKLLESYPTVRRKVQGIAARRHTSNLAAALELGRRREVRIRFHHEVNLELEGEPPRRATLENLSLGGLCLRGAPETWREDEKVRFGLGLAVGMLPLAGRVAWRRSHLPQGDAVGLAFDKASAQHDKMIQMAIHLLLETSPLRT